MNRRLQLLVADAKEKIYSIPQLEATGMKAGRYFKLKTSELIKLPAASRLFLLPNRIPIAYDPARKYITPLDKNGNPPGKPGVIPQRRNKFFPVAAFTPPGYTITYNSAYQETGYPKMLPLFSYAACAYCKGDFYVAAVKVDNDKRHDSCLINMGKVKTNVVKFRRIFAHNRLVRHMETCALHHNCPNAQNFFLSRYEAPLPISPICNAACAGCISYQAAKRCPATQPRIKFVPTPQEVADIAVFHISNTKDPIVSFGQGCEGEPLLAGTIIEQAIRLIRKETPKGLININTNASKPKIIARLFDAGLDTMRVSANSVQPEYYRRYYRPKGYCFNDVLKSIEAGKRRRGFVSLNYLTMPGFTDSKDEFQALIRFIHKYKINMIQWRNLNYDPLLYFKELKISIPPNQMLGIRQIIHDLKQKFPGLRMGYFNPRKIGH